MVVGLIGIAIAIVIFCLVLLFVNPQPNPAIANPLKEVLLPLGFQFLDTVDPLLPDIKATLRATAYEGVLEQAYRRGVDDLVLCGVADSDNNHLVAMIAQPFPSEPWILLHLPSAKGMIGSMVRKMFDVALSRCHFVRVEPEVLGVPSTQFELYTQTRAALPTFEAKLINVLPHCGNLILRSSGQKLLIERLSLTRQEPWEEEIWQLVRTTTLIQNAL
ncbi:hypothetical protein NBE99_10060 [Thermosynechococcus sp. HN-54]|uniref:hypothetical protein n=1 Tax=Thermosynechococcus sp. HN-54 TaxID=2933959 RepID=UPI00202CE04D|nr:hypothetical protein [Thermosynechococcus sp. HN-54]URR34979.1 hypothetical protein NBE99_10060 [Thermosynechococcus sp. HN-54]